MSKEEIKKIIDTIKQEEYPYALAIAKEYEKLKQENEELNFILTEFEKWLESKLKNNYLDNEIDKGYQFALKNCLSTLQDLKGEIDNGRK